MRRRRADIRPVTPDPKYSSELVSRFVNVVMICGKKQTAESIVYGALDIMAQKVTEEPVLKVFARAVDNVRPKVELKARRVGGATYQVPVEVSKVRGEALAMRWLITAARARGEHTMEDRLAGELQAAANQNGAAVKKREDTHRMAEANRAFSHFRW